MHRVWLDVKGDKSVANTVWMYASVILKSDNVISESFYLEILMPLLTCRTLKNEQHGSELIITTQPDGQKWLFSSGRMIICTLNLHLNWTNPDKSSTAFVICVYFKENVWVFLGGCDLVLSFLANLKNAKKCSLPSQAYSGPLGFY